MNYKINARYIKFTFLRKGEAAFSILTLMAKTWSFLFNCISLAARIHMTRKQLIARHCLANCKPTVATRHS